MAPQPITTQETLRIYHGLFSNVQMPLMVLRVTLEPGRLDVRMVDANAAARVLSPGNAAEIAGARAEEMFPELFDASFGKICQQAIESGLPVDFGLRSLAGAFYRVSVFPMHDAYLGVTLRDTTEHKRTEEALVSLRKLSTSVHATVDIEQILDQVLEEASLILGAEQGLVALCCPDGYSSTRSVRLGQLVAPGNEQSSDARVPARIYFGADPHLSNDPLHDPRIDPGMPAAHRVRNLVNTPILENDREMVGFLEIQNKIGPAGFTRFELEQLATVAQIAAQAVKNAKDFGKIAQNAAELEQRVAERTAQLQELNDELDAFAFSVSHGLRAPLRAILSFAQILQDGNETLGESKCNGFLGRIISAGQDMDQMILDLLSYSRLSRQDIMLQTVSLSLVVDEAIARAAQDAKFRLEVAHPLPEVRGNHAVLVQVVINLVSNAVKYVAPGITPALRIWGEQGDGTTRLFVQDNGIGIAPENQERIFEVFERLHGVESYPGTGIGLAIARKAVTRLGGRIGVASRLGEGSRFWIELETVERANGDS